MIDRGVDGDGLADLRAQGRHRHAIALHRQFDRRPVVLGVEHARLDGDVLADDAEFRGFDEFNPPVALAFMAGDQPVHRRVEAKNVGGGNVVNDAVGDEDRRAHPLRRRVAEGLLQRVEQQRAAVVGIVGGGIDGAHLDIVERVQFGEHLLFGLLGLLRAVVEPVAAGVVDDHGDDVFERATVLVHQRWAGEAEQQKRGGGETQPRSTAAIPKGKRGQRQGHDAEHDQRSPGQLRGKGERPGVQCESLSIKSFACT